MRAGLQSLLIVDGMTAPPEQAVARGGTTRRSRADQPSRGRAGGPRQRARQAPSLSRLRGLPRQTSSSCGRQRGPDRKGAYDGLSDCREGYECRQRVQDQLRDSWQHSGGIPGPGRVRGACTIIAPVEWVTMVAYDRGTAMVGASPSPGEPAKEGKEGSGRGRGRGGLHHQGTPKLRRDRAGQGGLSQRIWLRLDDGNVRFGEVIEEDGDGSTRSPPSAIKRRVLRLRRHDAHDSSVGTQRIG